MLRGLMEAPFSQQDLLKQLPQDSEHSYTFPVRVHCTTGGVHGFIHYLLHQMNSLSN